MAPFIEEILKQRIVEQLMWDESVNANDVHIDIIDNTARLTGSVPNYTAKLAAERNAYQVDGINYVENLLEVQFPPTITIPSDEEIKNNILNIFSWYDVFSENITVNVKNNVVNLTGTVDRYVDKKRAEEVSNSVKGVMDVNNLIKITPRIDCNDLKTEKDIKEALKRNVLIDEAKINVDVNQGVAVISGTVSNQLIKKEIDNIVLNTKGVLHLVNDIIVM